MRSFLLILLLLFLLPVTALAQTDLVSVTVDYSDGKSEVSDSLTVDQATEMLKTFLKGQRDGTFKVTQGPVTMMEAQRTGEKLQLTSAGKTSTGTVQEALGNFERAHASGLLAGCSANLSNIGIALEMWAGDHQGALPENLQQLVPKYLSQPLFCPSSKEPDSYSAGYHKSSISGPYLVRCNGDHSGANLAKGFPAYSSSHGLILKEGELNPRATP